MDSVYLKLAGDARVKNYIGLEMLEGYSYKHGKGYLYIEIPLSHFLAEDNATEVKRNQHVAVIPACTINVKGGSIVEIEPNPMLAAYGQVQAGYKVHPESGKQVPSFYFTARRDISVDLFKDTYAIRLYLLT